MIVRTAIIVAVVIASIASALADALTCSQWQGVTTCQSPHGYVSHESTWNEITTGDDNRGDRWNIAVAGHRDHHGHAA